MLDWKTSTNVPGFGFELVQASALFIRFLNLHATTVSDARYE